MVSEFCVATHLLQSATDVLIAVTDRSLVGSFLFANKKHDRLCRASNRCSATKVLQSSVNACIIQRYDDPPGSRTRISRTGILRAIHYTSGS